jgi:hypothetical protein
VAGVRRSAGGERGSRGVSPRIRAARITSARKKSNGVIRRVFTGRGKPGEGGRHARGYMGVSSSELVEDRREAPRPGYPGPRGSRACDRTRPRLSQPIPRNVHPPGLTPPDLLSHRCTHANVSRESN